MSSALLISGMVSQIASTASGLYGTVQQVEAAQQAYQAYQLQAAAAKYQGQATKLQADYNAVLAEMDAAQAGREAEYATYLAEYEASLLEIDAQTAEMEADYIRDLSEYDAALKRRETFQLIGSQRTAYAVSGVRLDEGSPMDVMSDTAAQGEQDALMIEFGGEVNAWQKEREAYVTRLRKQETLYSGEITAQRYAYQQTYDLARADLLRYEGELAEIGGNYGAGIASLTGSQARSSMLATAAQSSVSTLSRTSSFLTEAYKSGWLS